MATYEEIFEIRHNSTLLNKISTAISVKAKSVLDSGTSTAGQKNWAREAIKDPTKVSGDIIWYVLVANIGATEAQIINATDNSIQNNVNDAIDIVIADLT